MKKTSTINNSILFLLIPAGRSTLLKLEKKYSKKITAVYIIAKNNPKVAKFKT
jgi:hypothetical protein